MQNKSRKNESYTGFCRNGVVEEDLGPAAGSGCKKKDFHV